ncbi:Alpha/Beta hydrolase protein [Aspergillus lucknowensis]|uniref:Alpha/Beta hydrolase protein n=1 Tax=Aspergillus lucknowensis TaxID=176173 RepID=A0ABR4M4Z9_9EURO
MLSRALTRNTSTIMSALQQIHLVGSVLFDITLACFKGAFACPDGFTCKRFIIHAAVRSLFRRDRARTLQSNAPSTVQVYQACANRNGFSEEAVPLESGATGLWLSTPRRLPDNGKILIYFHGGAYVGPAQMAHFEMLLDQIKEHQLLSKQFGSKLAVLVVAYTLAPKGTYPLQLRQAASALNYVLQINEVSPSQILIAGDSAGGNLALSLISHISHPHPDPTVPPIKARHEGQVVLGGAFLISPWVTFMSKSSSMAANSEKDLVVQEFLLSCAELFLGNDNRDKDDFYTVPLNAPPEWWKEVKVQNLEIVAGEFEIFRDDILALAQKIKVHNPMTQVLLASKEVHAEMVLARILKLPPTQAEKFFKRWLKERVH